jgi:DNA gyrase inhibitor GyrI
MADNDLPPLSVSIQELSSIRVACIDYLPGDQQSGFDQGIRQCFQRLQAWVKELGYDPYALLTIGVPHVQGNQLVKYTCCVQAPETIQSGSQEIGIQELPGGHYAVMTIQKDPAIIGSSIGRFYQEYISQHSLVIDAARPTYEIYYQDTMEYCVPVGS